MKISRNWLNNYLVSNKSNEDLVNLFTQLGLECTFKKIKLLPDDIVIGKINTCSKHPNADRLKVCKVDIGNNDIIDIICGAPNVRKNLLVPVAKIGSIIGGIKIKKTKIRGVTSNGMICSEKELGLSDSHEGIMILDSKFEKGHNLKEFLSIKEDTIFDFDITPNRGDCFSHIGIARELSILEKSKLKIKNYELKSLDLERNDETFNINIDKDKCKRYVACIIRNVSVKESPSWLKECLSAIGQKSINNIVDAANFILMDLGHPMHTFDFDKIKSESINVRLAKKNETIITLDECKQKLNSDNLLICDGNNPIAIAGIIGGNNSGVDENTKNILIESAIFDPVNIRKSSKSLGISTEASKRFERGTDINMLIPALNKLAHLIQDIAGGKVSSKIFDVYDHNYVEFDSNGFLHSHMLKEIPFDIAKCNDFLGTELNLKEVKKIFGYLYIDCRNVNKKIICTIPSFRNDLYREIDLFEEIARVYGYDNIPSNSSFVISNSCFVKDELYLENNIRSILCSNGFNEHYSNSLYSDKDIETNSQSSPVEILNPLNQEMKYLRNDLLPGLLKAVSYNEKREHSFLKIFEIGSSTVYDKSKYNNATEYRDLGLIWTSSKIKHWKYNQVNDVYSVKGEIINLLKMLSFKKIHLKVENNIIKIFIDDSVVGTIFEISNKIRNDYDIKNNLFYCKIDIQELSRLSSTKSKFASISNFPSINRDISILINKKYLYSDIVKTISSNANEYLEKINLFDVYSDKNTSPDEYSLSFSLKFCSKKRTLEDQEVDVAINKILNSLKETYNVIQR